MTGGVLLNTNCSSISIFNMVSLVYVNVPGKWAMEGSSNMIWHDVP